MEDATGARFPDIEPAAGPVGPYPYDDVVAKAHNWCTGDSLNAAVAASGQRGTLVEDEPLALFNSGQSRIV